MSADVELSRLRPVSLSFLQAEPSVRQISLLLQAILNRCTKLHGPAKKPTASLTDSRRSSPGQERSANVFCGADWLCCEGTRFHIIAQSAALALVPVVMVT